MKIIISTLILLSILLLYSCTKEINLGLDGAPKRLVIEGNIYNTPGPYIIRLTLSNPALENHTGQGGIDYVEAVKNATVIISDETGIIDTLQPSPDTLRRFAKFYRNRNKLDSFYRVDANYFNGERGFYQTTKIIGTSGRTYSLRVLYNNKEYNASAYMPTVPTLDSVKFKVRPGIKDNITYKVPTLYFREDINIDNYYWTFSDFSVNDRRTSAPIISSTREILPFSIFDDRFLQPYVNGIYSDFTYARNATQGDIIRHYGFVYLCSLTQQHYNFLKLIIDQVESDGGTYKPTPSSPLTNISNNGLGYFGASAISRVFVFDPDFY